MFRRIWCVLPFFLIACKDSPPGPPPNNGPDTTSHEFTWAPLDSFGGITGSDFLRDVFIINDSSVWAVGEISGFDTTGPFGQLPIGAMHWNGSEWTPRRIVTQFTSTPSNVAPVRGVFAFSNQDVWFAAGSVVHWNGSTYVGYPLRLTILSGSETVEKLWGTASNNLYGVGNAGTMVYFDGSTWQKLNSGTTVDIQDIWGALDPTNGELVILAVASFGPQVPQAKGLLQINPLTHAVTAISDSGLSTNVHGIWFEPGKKYYVSGAGLFSSSVLGNVWQRDTTQPLIYKDAIRGNAVNDIVIAGSFGLVSHFNGLSWMHFNTTPSFYGAYYAVSFKRDFVVAVGWIDEKAVALRGTRQ